MKRLYIIMFIFLLTLLIVPVRVYAQDNEELPDTYIKLTYDSHYYVQENEQTYEYIVVYNLYHHVKEVDEKSNYAYSFRYNQPFYRGLILRDTNSYVLDEYILQEDKVEFHFIFTLRKYLVDETYSGDITKLFEDDSEMFIKTVVNLYEKGFNDGVKSVIYKPYSMLFNWTVPFVTLIIFYGIYIGYKREWFKK